MVDVAVSESFRNSISSSEIARSGRAVVVGGVYFGQRIPARNDSEIRQS
jgi:hypothetical protein